MLTRVLSLIRGSDAGAARPADPALDVNAYAVADDVELTLVLTDHGVELGLARAACHPAPIAGVDVPAATPAIDLEALLASGVRVVAVAEDLGWRGLTAEDLLDGIEVVPRSALAALLTDHDVTLTTVS